MGKEEMHTECCGETFRKDGEVDGRMTLKWILGI
jgi:hypothetical protein